MTKILVTGGCGFVGSNLVDILVQDDNNEVLVVDSLDTGKKEYCNEKAKYIFADIRDVFGCSITEAAIKLIVPKYLTTLMRNVDIVFHLAALARIQPSFGRPLETLDVNAKGTALVCEYARNIGAKMIYAGSSSFYAGQYLNPYAFSKWQGEEVCKMYSEVYDTNTAIARFFNVYGNRHPSEGPYGTVIGIFERQYLNKNPLTVTGNGNQRRDFTHVKDICSGLIELSKGVHSGAVYNLGTGKNHSINELAAMYTESEVEFIPPRPGEAWETLADISKTTDKVGWSPKHSLEEYVNNWVQSVKCGGKND